MTGTSSNSDITQKYAIQANTISIITLKGVFENPEYSYPRDPGVVSNILNETWRKHSNFNVVLVMDDVTSMEIDHRGAIFSFNEHAKAAGGRVAIVDHSGSSRYEDSIPCYPTLDEAIKSFG